MNFSDFIYVVASKHLLYVYFMVKIDIAIETNGVLWEPYSRNNIIRIEKNPGIRFSKVTISALS